MMWRSVCLYDAGLEDRNYCARMTIPKILQLLPRPLIPIIPPPLPTHPILPPKPRKKHHARTPTDPHHPQTNPKPSRIRRGLLIKEDITRNKPTAIPKSYLHRRCNRLLVVPGHVVAQPAHEYRLRHVPATGDGVESEIARADGDGPLADQNHVADCGDDAAGQGKGEAVAELIAGVGGCKCDGCCDDVDRDAHYLGADGGPA